MMSAASFTTTLIPSPTISTSPSFPCKTTKLSTSCFSFNNNVLKTTLKPSSLSTCRVFAAPEALDSQATLDPLPDILDGPDSDTFQVGDSETSSHQSVSIAADADMIMDAARTTNAKTMGPVPLPTKKRVYCVLKSPHVHKDARFHFEIRTHQRLIDILYPTAQTIDSLMQLDLPAGVDVEVKL
ncbi:hypothetical protein D5086_021760 [Populus alba]|uniref:Uncharacterized protein n=1 Tax=Populus alba TaxID=43335 RepID=A0ACC4BD34_POPAL